MYVDSWTKRVSRGYLKGILKGLKEVLVVSKWSASGLQVVRKWSASSPQLGTPHFSHLSNDFDNFYQCYNDENLTTKMYMFEKLKFKISP